MSLNPQIDEMPPGNAFMATVVKQGGATDTTFAAAYTAALADAASRGGINGVVTSVDPFLIAYTRKFTGINPSVAVLVGTYELRGIAATCFLKAFWDEVLYNTDIDGNIIDEVGRNSQTYTFTMPSIGGVCLPAGFIHDDSTTWISGGVVNVTQPTPPDPAPTGVSCQSLYIEKFRWALVSGYTPPDDGSANGFPG